MSLEQLVSGLYKEFAGQAVIFEQQAQWKDAALYWQKAEASAKRKSNREWASRRQELCLHYASRPVYRRTRRNVNDITP
ncbi:ANR family transcriptional regulator [Vibrio sp. TBV020]|uniref:ANR family transcriptional regulator n=1 Tax=Vibrio sp. TBV020 TaxID=3137398 RepID=UPI0038CD55F2